MIPTPPPPFATTPIAWACTDVCGELTIAPLQLLLLTDGALALLTLPVHFRRSIGVAHL